MKSSNNILLINIDSKIDNLALKKIEKYHKDKGDEVLYGDANCKDKADLIYVSCVFTKNKDLCEKWESKGAIIGGSGYNLKTKLPNEIDKVKPKINLGFTTRGCIRNCYFCIVPEKEGKIYVEGDIYDIWDGKSKEIVLLDNNILALHDHFFKIANQLQKEKIKVDFNQGLDYRLLTEDIVKKLLELKHTHEIRFAFDDIKQYDSVEKTLVWLKNLGLKKYKTRWYLYIGEKDTWDTVYNRMKLLKKYEQRVYVMRDERIKHINEFKALNAWGNAFGAFKYELKDLIERSVVFKRYKKLNLPL